MSGYFVLTRSFLNVVVRRLSGVGFKILVDILSSSPRPVRLKEVPYQFRSRLHGESKLDINTGVEYFLLVADKLLGGIAPPRYVGYVVVGLIGLLVYLVGVHLLHNQFSLSLVEAQAIATFVAIVFKFATNNATTFQDIRLRGWRLLWGFVTFCGACALGAVANIGVAEFLTARGVPWYLAVSLGLVVGSVWNYGVTAVLTWHMLQRRTLHKVSTEMPDLADVIRSEQPAGLQVPKARAHKAASGRA